MLKYIKNFINNLKIKLFTKNNINQNNIMNINNIDNIIKKQSIEIFKWFRLIGPTPATSLAYDTYLYTYQNGILIEC